MLDFHKKNEHFITKHAIKNNLQHKFHLFKQEGTVFSIPQFEFQFSFGMYSHQFSRKNASRLVFILIKTVSSIHYRQIL